jgi:hypothetical protein
VLTNQEFRTGALASNSRKALGVEERFIVFGFLVRANHVIIGVLANQKLRRRALASNSRKALGVEERFIVFGFLVRTKHVFGEHFAKNVFAQWAVGSFADTLHFGEPVHQQRMFGREVGKHVHHRTRQQKNDLILN